MRRVVLALVGGMLLVATAARSAANFSHNPLTAAPGGKQPWTSQAFNDSAETFRFAIVSDRTGGHRAGIFSRAIAQLNLLQPEFVLSVGDLIEGYNDNTEEIKGQWKEFDGYIGKLQMPFFHVAGNHDLATPPQVEVWKSRFNRVFYHFLYKKVLFLCLNTEDVPEGKKGTTRISPEQTEYFARVLRENRDVKWTVVAMHKPVWAMANADEVGWPTFEKLLLDRPYTVFAGHVHHYQKFIRHGRNYYHLATTGGVSKLRGMSYGEFDHFTWVTMKKEGPVVANLLLSGILPEDLSAVEPVAEEQGTPIKDRRKCYEASGIITLDGKPIENAEIIFHYMVPPAEQPKVGNKKLLRSCDGLSDAHGRFGLSTYVQGDGAPAGEFIVTVVPFKSRTGLPVMAPAIPARYAKPDSSPLRITVKEGKNEIRIDLQRD